MRVLIGICLVLAISGYAAAEEAMFDWEMREWTSSDGLPDGYVADLSKDPQGFVWIATYGGLCRFDGKEFVNFSKLRVEEHPDVPVMPTALWKSPTGTIWIGDAEGGIVTYKNGGFEKLVLESEWSKQLIVEFECDQDGNVWVLDSMGNLVRFSDGFYLPVVSYKDGLPTGSSLAKDKASGMLYAAIRGYLWRLSGGEPELVGFPDSEVQGTVPIGISSPSKAPKSQTIIPL